MKENSGPGTINPIHLEIQIHRFLEKKCHRNYVAFKFCLFPNFLRLFDRKLRFIGLSAKKTYFNSILYQDRAIL